MPSPPPSSTQPIFSGPPPPTPVLFFWVSFIMLQSLVLLQALFSFVLTTVLTFLRLPVSFTTTKARTLLFGDYQSQLDEAIEVIETLKRSPSANIRDQARLEHAAKLLRRSSSSGKDLVSLTAATAHKLEVKDTNRLAPSSWFSQAFPDFSWAMTSSVESQNAVPPRTQRALLKEEVLEAKKVQQEIMATARLNGWTEKQARGHAEKIFEEMACDPWMPVMRLVGYVLRKVLRLLYPFGINVAVSDLERVKAMAAEGTVVYFPCHKSYIDFLVISYICFSHGLPLPCVVSGENLNIPIVGRILRHGGAFFIRRTFGNDELYKAVFNQYVTSLLVHGNTLECFIEGGRSRSGKVLPPKPGFVRILVDAVADGVVDDIKIIPISLNYDKLVENENYIKELTGGEKKGERLFAFLSSSANIIIKAMKKTLCFGQINVGFGVPFSVADTLKQYPELTPDSRKLVTKNLGYRTLYAINYSNTVLTTAIVGTILLTQNGRGISIAELTKKAKWLRREILLRGGRVKQESEEEVSSSLNAVVENVLESKSGSAKKNRLVKRFKDLLMLSLYSPAEQMELSLYRNQLIHYFVSEGVVACALYACEKDATISPALVTKGQLFEKVEFLSKLLKLEFVYKPSPAISETFDDTIALMIRRNVLDQPSEETYCVDERVSAEEGSGTYMYLFLCSLLWPFIESYWLASLGFLRLAPNKIMDEKTFIMFLQDLGERLYFEGLMDLYESISQETLQNALTLYESWGIIQFLEIEGQVVHAPGKRIIQLAPTHRSEEKVEEFVNALGIYRQRVTAYSSRRFKIKKNDFIADAIAYIKSTFSHKEDLPTNSKPGHE